MRIQFVINNDQSNVVADFDVERIPTPEEVKGITSQIQDEMDEYEAQYGDFEDFDYYSACSCAVQKHLKVIHNPVVRTIYI